MDDTNITVVKQNGIERLDGDFPRFLLNPFEVISPDDPRYDSALTREELIAIEQKTAQQ